MTFPYYILCARGRRFTYDFGRQSEKHRRLPLPPLLDWSTALHDRTIMSNNNKSVVREKNKNNTNRKRIRRSTFDSFVIIPRKYAAETKRIRFRRRTTLNSHHLDFGHGTLGGLSRPTKIIFNQVVGSDGLWKRNCSVRYDTCYSVFFPRSTVTLFNFVSSSGKLTSTLCSNSIPRTRVRNLREHNNVVNCLFERPHIGSRFGVWIRTIV